MRAAQICAAGALVIASATALAQSVNLSPAQEAVLRQFKSKAEPTAKDAIWTSATMFKVGVLDNGKARDGYALYVCEAMAERGLSGRGMSVQIIDIIKLSATGKWVKLGEAHCR